MRKELKGKGANVIKRMTLYLLLIRWIATVPTAGLNFEYIFWENPYLGAILVERVIATAKHFVNIEIKNDRIFVSANVNERVRFEIYYPPFEAAEFLQ